jgi:DNA-binding transcriptional MerR regulator
MVVSEAERGYGLLELCERGRVTVRTVRYYVAQGLLPAPPLGAGARYSQAHLDRLLVIRRLQRAHLPLAEIRRRLDAAGDAGVQAMLPLGFDEDDGTALSLDNRAASGVPAAAGGRRRRVAAQAGLREAGAAAAEVGVGRVAAAPSGDRRYRDRRAQERRAGMRRSEWQRIELAVDIELHVRRPLARWDNRALERLLEAAARIFEEES